MVSWCVESCFEGVVFDNVVYLVFADVALGNTALDNSWTPLGYGQCTVAPIPGMERVGPPYSGENANPLIAEGVFYQYYFFPIILSEFSF